MKTLFELYQEHEGKCSDKWTLYLREYDRLFLPYRNKKIDLLEIGIQNGGSLEVWLKYFDKVNSIIGCDINTNCSKLIYDDKRVSVIVGDATNTEVVKQVLDLTPKFDIVIDDGSHDSDDIIRAFAYYWDSIKDGGMFVAEDLHCSYWGDCQGGLSYPYSSIAFFKKLADIINFEHWGITEQREWLMRGFYAQYGITIEDLASIHSVEFVNSMCIVRKDVASNNVLGTRFIAGNNEIVAEGHKPLHGTGPILIPQHNNLWAKMDVVARDEKVEMTSGFNLVGDTLYIKT